MSTATVSPLANQEVLAVVELSAREVIGSEDLIVDEFQEMTFVGI